MQVIAAKEGLYAIIQEDSGNVLGERMFITKLEHEADGKELEYHFIAQSGGSHNTRMKMGVGIPARTNMAPGGHEFSGVIDMSAFVLLAEDFEDSMDRRELAADNEADYAQSGIRRNLQNCKGEWKCRFKTNGDCTCRCRCSSKCRRKCNCRGKGSCDDLEIEEEPEMDSKWAVSAGDAVTSHMARMATPINDKLIAVGLQSHNFYGGAVTAFRADRGGQILLYKPSL